MKLLYNKNIRLLAGGILVFLLILCASCASNKEYIKYTTDQIYALQKVTNELKESTGASIDTINASQASIMVEIDALKNELRDLAGRVEDNEHLIKHNLEKELGEQGDAKTELSVIAEKLERLENMVKHHHQYLNLEPFEYINKTGPATPVGEGNVTTLNTIDGVEKPRDVLLYESSLDLFNDGKYDQALSSFKSFLGAYPKSDLADNSQFWIGECYMGLNQYDHAILEFDKVIKNYPKENKVPNAMYRQAIAMQKIGELTGAKILLNKLIKMYPKSPEAADAEKKLAAMK
ncbi:MAG: tol-pal system protein YbgF [Deltaproteobacteria bacterium]|nr:tol-pal system protein YbgF [Deltaproteobacteria bacterium]